MDTLAVTVIIPTFNRAAVLPRAVASALACVRAGDEVLVVDDGSTDDTAAALAPFDDRIRHVRVSHGGAGRARNQGIAATRTPLVAFLDSDDEWVPDKLDLQRTVMSARPDVVFSFTDFASRHDGRPDEHGQLARWHGDTRGWSDILGPAVPYSSLGRLPPGRDDLAVHVGDLYTEVLGGHFVPTFTLMVNRELAGGALRFAEDVTTYEDLECHARLAQVGRAAYLDCETAYQWGHAGPRLTDATVYACASARLTVIERIYGEDPAFLAAHGPRFRREVRAQHLLAARWLMSRGRADEARTQVAAVGDAPITYRLAARMPGWSTAAAARGLHSIRRAAHAARIAVHI